MEAHMKKMILTALTSLMATFGLTVLGDESGLIAHWPINEGTGTEIKDISGNNNHGKLLNAENSKWVDGRSGGKALLFDNLKAELKHHSCITIPQMGKYDFSKGVTIEAWINFSSSAKRESMYMIVMNAGGDRGMWFEISWNRLLMQSADGKNIFWQVFSSTGENPIIRDRWHHVAGTYNGSIYTLYINGMKCAESQEGAKLTQGRDILSIGAYADGYVDGFCGIISDVKIYSQARTALEIIKAAKGEDL
jgi:hypothetical protein